MYIIPNFLLFIFITLTFPNSIFPETNNQEYIKIAKKDYLALIERLKKLEEHVYRRRTEDGGQRTEDRGQRTEDGERKTANIKIPKIEWKIYSIKNNPAASRDLISLKTLKKNKEAFLERLLYTRMDYPLMPAYYSKYINSLFSDSFKTKFDKNFDIIIYLDKNKWSYETLTLLNLLRNNLTKNKINKNNSKLIPKIQINFIDYIRNYNNIIKFIQNISNFSTKSKNEAIKTFIELKEICKQILNFKIKTIKGLSSLDQIKQDKKYTISNNLFMKETIKNSIGMREKDITNLLDLLNETDFIQMALERTKEIIPKASNNTEIKQILSTITPADAIVIASYFARTRIDKYGDIKFELSNIDDTPFAQTKRKIILGDCKHFSGLTAHYINKIIKPLNPKLKNWYFGVETTHIGDYHHGFLKAVNLYHYNQEDKIDIFMFDPTKLANEMPDKLSNKKIKKVIDAFSDDKHYLRIKRYAEDFLKKPVKKNDPDSYETKVINDIYEFIN